jgi:hypothetical protein
VEGGIANRAQIPLDPLSPLSIVTHSKGDVILATLP